MKNIIDLHVIQVMHDIAIMLHATMQISKNTISVHDIMYVHVCMLSSDYSTYFVM